ncbi:Cytochrome c553 [Malonomonas rubra DSM 5091]|uniref:Cytochrome c553 n=1 Tax=Malonomonas rubra DSM 5091 TaxID=1122189 RepID=A0A1M6J876_MALRU|nr:c-type cytochrome [Malonomonas rubra]SHJ42864.1 Cytochrome c553 [Malonomonas rubra DSM 5091]
MKRFIVLLIIFSMVLALTSVAYAASSRRGKKVFAKVCETCHIKGSDAGKLKPSKKTMSQWKRFVEKNKHDADPNVLKNLSSKDRKNLLKFLQEYALDADTIETCG